MYNFDNCLAFERTKRRFAVFLSFKLKNWRCFRDEQNFTMEASREDNLSETLTKINKFRINLLPVTAIYGGNASGKSSFIKAIRFLQHLVTKEKDLKTVSLSPLSFQLDPENSEEPSSFELALFLNNNIYIYSVVLNKFEILKEELSLQNTSSTKTIFKRDKKLVTVGKFLEKKLNKQKLEAIQTLLGNGQTALSMVQKFDETHCKLVYDWFVNHLQVITPDSRRTYASEDETVTSQFILTCSELLKKLGTGVEGIRPFLYTDPLPGAVEQLMNEVPEENVLIYTCPDIGCLVLKKENGKTIANKLFTTHLDKNGNEICFSFSEESEGTIRLLDIIPIFAMLEDSDAKKLFLVDEIERSLHPKLLKHLLARYQNYCNPDNLNQLIFTTHNVELLDKDYLRRDEIWFCDKAIDGSSELYSLSAFKDVRIDTNLKTNYMDGVWGGVPYLAGSGGKNQLPTATNFHTEANYFWTQNSETYYLGDATYRMGY